MRRLSKKRASQENKYRTIRKKFLEQNPDCIRCNGMATEIHHAKGRIGDLLLDTQYFKPVCRYCHHWIENHPKEAKELGLSVSRLI